MSNNQTPDYYIAPKGSFDATADAIRAVNGTNQEITWGQNGFADAIGTTRKYTADEIAYSTLTGDVVVNGNGWIKTYAFFGQSGMTSFSAPNATGLGSSTFQNCSGCTSFYTPKMAELYGSNAFNGCSSVKTLCFPKGGISSSHSYLYNNAFSGCTNLETIDLGGITRTGNQTFQNDGKLTTIIFRYVGLVTLGNTNVFTNTPYAEGGTGGTIYIPKSLYDHLGDGTSNDYKAATNWSIINGYGTITWAKIEGSYYETHYADGTTIPTT